MSDHPAPPLAANVCLLGESGLGKSTLWRRLTGSVASSNEGIVIASVRFTKPAKRPVALWDVASRVALDSVGQVYLARADGVLALADATRADTLERALQLLARVSEVVPRCARGLLINKVDLVPDTFAAPLFPGITTLVAPSRSGDQLDAVRAWLLNFGIRP